MPNPTEVPTPAALADLVARCNEMTRYSTELTAAEETRVAALASAIVTMRQVLELATIPSEHLTEVAEDVTAMTSIGIT